MVIFQSKVPAKTATISNLQNKVPPTQINLFYSILYSY